MVKRMLAFALSFFMVNSTIDYPGMMIANAAVWIKAYTITAFEALDGTKEYQTLSFGAEESDILFPDSLKAAVEYTVYEKPEEYPTEENTAAGEFISFCLRNYGRRTWLWQTEMRQLLSARLGSARLGSARQEHSAVFSACQVLFHTIYNEPIAGGRAHYALASAFCVCRKDGSLILKS